MKTHSFCLIVAMTISISAQAAFGQAVQGIRKTAGNLQRQVNGQQQQQQPPKPSYITSKGTLGEIKKKGRATTLVIVPDAGEPVEVVVTPRIQFSVQGKGDDGFLQAKQMVSGTGVLTNKMLFVKNWTVHVGLSARKMKTGVAKADKKIGQSVNSYNLAGMITSRQKDKDYPEYETLLLNVRQLKGQPIYIDKNPTITVSSTDASMAKEGSKVEYYQVPAPGNRFRIIGVKVMLDDPLKAEEFFAKDDKKSKTKRRTTSKKK